MQIYVDEAAFFFFDTTFTNNKEQPHLISRIGLKKKVAYGMEPRGRGKNKVELGVIFDTAANPSKSVPFHLPFPFTFTDSE